MEILTEICFYHYSHKLPSILNYYQLVIIIISMQLAIKRKILLDIGGTLAKLCYDAAATDKVAIPHNEKLTLELSDRKLYFMYFKNIEDCWNYIETYFCIEETHRVQEMAVTGGGAYKYESQLKIICKKKDIEFFIVQEFESLIAGLSFFKINSEIKEFIGSIFTKTTHEVQKSNISFHQLKCPILVVNVGSGVSILKVEEKENKELTAERVGGTSLGGGFFMGLANLLIGQNNFHKLLEMAQQGNVSNTDIIPSDFPEISEQFSEASVLVSLGKLNSNSKKEDIVKSLFYMVTFNIAQISLSYSQLLSIDNVLFTGFYCRDNDFVLECFAEAFNFFTKNKKAKNVYSMKHDGFLGALGAFYYQLNK